MTGPRPLISSRITYIPLPLVVVRPRRFNVAIIAPRDGYVVPQQSMRAGQAPEEREDQRAEKSEIRGQRRKSRRTTGKYTHNETNTRKPVRSLQHAGSFLSREKHRAEMVPLLPHEPPRNTRDDPEETIGSDVVPDRCP